MGLRSASLFLLAGLSPLLAQADPHAGHAQEAREAAKAAPATRNPALPPDADGAKAALAESPRHGEWVDIPLAEGKKLLAWVVYPETKKKAGVVIVIHEIFGLSDWVRAVADQAAKDGFIAIAPDFLSGLGPKGGGTDELGDAVGKTIRTLTPAMMIERMDAARAYGLKLPAANGRAGTLGFCWGGSTSFNYAVVQPKLDAAVVYYGTSPADPAAYAQIKAPVLGFYGGDDARVNATIPTAEAEMKKLRKRYTANVLDGAGHGFLRQQSGREGANARAATTAWPMTLAFLRERLAP
ncbi:MAG: dienelactone hydrolase family protein [Holophagaceae bacterium]|nr:dienelactone hydrolase family protein [Holophagaceae bacterium]